MTYEELYGAWRAFRRGKKHSSAIDTFAYSLEQELAQLAHEVATRSYRHGGYQKVMVREKKRRDLAVASVRDRVIHRYVHDRLVDCYDASFDPDVWSCRRGKGLYGALARTQVLLARYPYAFVWRADIHKFFDHVDHARLERAVERKLEPSSELAWLCRQIIESYTTTSIDLASRAIGIPIGNLTSQVFANIYLNEFDRFVRHTLKPLGYLRYGDDFIVIASNRQDARQFCTNAQEFLARELGLRLHARNNVIVPTTSGLHFLGHVVTDTYIVVDRYTSRAALQKVYPGNASSYASLKLAKYVRRELYWWLLDQLEEAVGM